jgi:hypothetical protein
MSSWGLWRCSKRNYFPNATASLPLSGWQPTMRAKPPVVSGRALRFVVSTKGPAAIASSTAVGLKHPEPAGLIFAAHTGHHLLQCGALHFRERARKKSPHLNRIAKRHPNAADKNSLAHKFFPSSADIAPLLESLTRGASLARRKPFRLHVDRSCIGSLFFLFCA